MDIILYNPLSSKGKNVKLAQKLEKKLIKQSREVLVTNLLTIVNVKDFLEKRSENDRIIILGGDGTLHRIVNQIEGYQIKPEVYLYKAGTGNDFIRSIPVKNKLGNIKPYIQDLPILYVNGKRMRVINGGGVGLDGLVAYKVNKSKSEKNKSNYFKNAMVAFYQFKPVKAKITIDGESFEEKKLWFASCMYSKYFGGGMMIAPKKERTQKEIELVIVKNVPKLLLMIIFPTIYFGWHRIFKRWVKFYRGQDITVEFEEPAFLQADGEHEYPVTKYQMRMEIQKK